MRWASPTSATFPKRRKAKVRLEARIFVAAYAALALGSVALWSPALLWAWIVPILFGQPFLRAYLLAEHARCPHVANMLENTRTTFTTALVRFDGLEHAVPCRAPRLSGGAVPQAAALSRDRAGASAVDGARLRAAFNRKFAGDLPVRQVRCFALAHLNDSAPLRAAQNRL